MKNERITPRQWLIVTLIVLHALFASITAKGQSDTLIVKAKHDSICRCGNYTAKDGQQYSIYVGPKGGMYVWRTSAKGVKYKQYVKKSK